MERLRPSFFNRKHELALLHSKYSQIELTQKGVMLALYGRRRVGKTELVKHFISSLKEQVLYFYVDLGERHIIFNSLATAIKEQTNDIVNILEIEDFFNYLIKKLNEKRFVLVFDEFQRFLDIAPDFITSLQNFWDSHLKNQKVMILLVGSSIGMMQKIIDSKAGALYGRAQKIKISPFRYQDARLMFSELSEQEKISRYAIFGGTPYYLEKTKIYKTSFEALHELVLKKDSELSNEPTNLLEYENVKVHAKYNSILQSISFGKEVLKEIQDFTKLPVSYLPPYINKLDNLLDLVKKNDPLLGKERLGRYKITDNFFKFWYTFVFENQSSLILGNTTSVVDLIKENLNSYTGRIFEDIVKELLISYNTKKIYGFSIHFENIGSWWDRNGNEIDIVAYNLKKKSFLLGEVKWTSTQLEESVVEGLYRKSKLLLYSGEFAFIFVSKSGFTKGAIEKIKQMNGLYLDLSDIEKLFDKLSQTI